MTHPDDQRDPEPTEYGSLSVEDDTDGTTDPADLAGTAGPRDAESAQQPSVSEADDTPA